MAKRLAEVPATWFTMAIFMLNSLLDEGERFSIDEVRREAESRQLMALITSDRFCMGKADFSHLAQPAGLEERAVLDELFEGLSIAVDSRRKFGVDHNGVCLVLAFFTEALQQWMDARGVRP
jgi:hypothetical protein